ncbi:fibronectin type III domain-containing protein [Parasediminibacterium sp. JCM 36343]|uniref:fibronectin type III domain-containing protein n=1 Tax=Parasediminibacterium sp. JCM 36343 TaxID=3374279 RepID=UPI00397A4B63
MKNLSTNSAFSKASQILKHAFMLVFAVLITSSVFAATYYWDGTTSIITTTAWCTNSGSSTARVLTTTHPSNFTTAGDVFVVQGSTNSSGTAVTCSGVTLPESVTLSTAFTTFGASATSNVVFEIEGGATVTQTAALFATTLNTFSTFQVDQLGNFYYNASGTGDPTAASGPFKMGTVSLYSTGTVANMSNVYIQNITTGTISAALPTFGNLFFYLPSAYSTIATVGGKLTTVKGNLTIGDGTAATTTSGGIQLKVNTSSLSIAGNLVINNGNFLGSVSSTTGNGSSITVTGDVILNGGDFSPTTTSTTACTISCTNFTMNGGTFMGGSTTGALLFGSSTLTISGALDIKGGTFNFIPNVPASTSQANTVNLAGNLIIEGGSLVCVGTNKVLSTPGAFNFNGATTFTFSSGTLTTSAASGNSIPFVVVAAKSLTLSNNFPLTKVGVAPSLTVNGTLDCGTKTVNGTGGIFTLAAAGTLKTANTGGLAATITCTGLTNTYTAGANYVFNGATTTPTLAAIATSALTANASATLNFTSTTGVAVGMLVTGLGIAANSTVSSYTATTVVLSAVTTGVSSGATVTFALPTVNNLTINAAVALNAPITIGSAGVLTLTSGILTTTTANLLSITNTASTAIAGSPSTSCYISGPINWTLATNASATKYSFPVGTSSAYLPFDLTYTASAATSTAQIQAFSGSFSPTNDGTISPSTSEYWSLTTTGAVFTLLKASLGKSSLGSNALIGTNTTGSSGSYSSIGGTIPATVGGINGIGVSNAITASPGTAGTFYLAMGALPAPTVTTGNASSITTTSAVLNGTINAANGAATNITFDYGTSTSYSSTGNAGSNSPTSAGATNVSTSYTIASGLTAATQYHFRVNGTSSAGTTNGSDATFYTLSNAPTAQATGVNFPSVGGTTLTVSWTQPGSGAGTNLIVVARAGGDPAANSGNPVNGTAYIGNLVFGNGTQIGTGNYVVYSGAATSSIAITGLSGGTTYYFDVYQFNGSGATQNYLTTSPAAGNQATSTAPPTVVTGTSGSITTSGATITSSSVTAIGGSAVIGEGVAWSTNSGAETIASGSNFTNDGTSTPFTSTISGLAAGTPYFVKAYATNSNGTNYGSEISFTTLSALPATQASGISFNNVSGNQLTLSWTAGSGVKSLVVVKQGSSPTAPTSGTSYTANASYGIGGTTAASSYVVYNSTGNTVTVTGLSVSTSYTFEVYTFNGAGGSENYLTSASTNNPNTQSTTANAQYIWTGATDNNWSTSTNWIPTRTSPATTDILLFDNSNGTPASVAITTMPSTQTIYALQVSNNTSVSLAGTSTLTVTSGVAVDATSAFTQGSAIAVTLGASESSIIAGTYTLASGAGALTTTGGTMSITGTLNINTTTAASFVTTGSVVTVLGTIVSTNTSSTAITATTSTLLFATSSASGGYTLTGNGGQVPAATWVNGTHYGNLNITGVTSATTIAAVSAPGAGGFGNIYFDAPGLTANPLKLFTNFPTALVVAGNLTLARTNSKQVQLYTSAGSTNGTFGSINLNCGSYLFNNGIYTTTVNGSFRMVDSLSATGGYAAAALTFGSSASDNLDVKGDFVQTVGTITSGASSQLIRFVGTSAQNATFGTLSGAGLGITINNSAGVTLNSALTVNGTFTLTAGILTTTSTNLLTLASTATLSGGSSSSYINGPMQNTLATTTGTALVFPIGKKISTTNYYSPVTLTVTQSTATSTTYKAEAFVGGTTPTHTIPGTLSAVSNNRYYTLSSSGSNIASATLGLVYDGTDASGISLSDLNLIRIAGSSGWVDLGGVGSANNTGTISSSNSFTALGDFVIATAVSLSTPPSLIAASGATVDNDFLITFGSNDATWLGAITTVKYGVNTLTAGTDYTISAGGLTLKPSGGVASGLRTPGTQSVVISATNYNNTSIPQAIAVGSATQLVITTQPVAPASSGAAFATQPVVKIEDKYGNVLTGSSASVTAAVGAGSWTIGGGNSVNASSGVASFLTLSGSATANASGSTIIFSSGALSVTSNTFTVLGPISYYWVGGTAATFGAIGTLATSLGGTPNASAYTGMNTPGNSDIIIFDGTDISNTVGNQTGTVALTLPSTVTTYYGQFIFQNNAAVTLTASGSRTLNIVGGAASDFSIDGTSSLTTLSASPALTITLATGATASISGTLILGETGAGGHQFIGTDAGSVNFQSGSVCSYNLSSTTFPFGTGTDSSVIFKNNSKLIGIKGADAFGGTGNTVIAFQSGSTYEYQAASASYTPSFGGRTFSIFSYNTATALSIKLATTAPITGNCTMDSLIVQAGSGAATFDFTGATLNILGNLVNNSASALTISPTANGTASLAFNGTIAQKIRNTGAGSIVFGSSTLTRVQNVTVNNNNGLILNGSITGYGIWALNNGIVTLGANNFAASSATGSSSSYIDASGTGKFTLNGVTTSATTFPIGTSSYYAPLILTGGTTGRNITTGVKSTLSHVAASPNNVVNLEWSILASAATSPTVTFQYNTLNQGTGYASTSPVLGTYVSAYAESALGTVSTVSSNTYSVATAAAIALPTTTANLYAIGNSHAFLLTVPGAPTSVTATAGNGQASVAFTPPVDNGGAAITTYTVTSTPGGFTPTGSSSPIVVTGLTNGTAYTFTVKATNSVGQSAASTASSAVTPVPITIWNGASWSAGIPSATSVATINANLSNAQWGGATSVAQIIVASGVTFANTGTISVTGSPFTNNGTISGGTIVLAATSAQTITGIGTVSSLTLSNSFGATVSSGSNKLNITGVLTLQSGILTTNSNLVFKSNSIASSGTLAAVGASGNSGSISGTVTVERYIPKGYRSYRDIAPGVYNTANTLYSTYQESGSYSNSGYGMFITGGTGVAGNTSTANSIDANHFDVSANAVKTAYTYINGTWATVTNTNTLVTPFTGYRLLIRGDRSFYLYGTSIDNTPLGLLMYNDTRLRASGTLVTGDVTYSPAGVSNAVTGSTYANSTFGLNNLTDSSFNLVANPYVCPVDWRLLTKDSIENYYYYLDPTLGATGAYVAGNSGSNQYIQAGQAIFIQNKKTFPKYPVIGFTEAAKAAGIGNQTAVFGGESKLPIVLLRAETAGAGSYHKMDVANIVFGNGYSNGYNGNEDVPKLPNSSDNLSIHELSTSKALSIDGRQVATKDDIIAIELAQVSKANYKLQIDATSYNSNSLVPYIYDGYTKTYTALSSGLNTISFAADNTVAASYANRFKIVFKPTVLAVNSIVATATLKEGAATVSWNTAGENKVAGYTVEKSTDGTAYTAIGTATAKNTATAAYSYVDNSVTGTTYYRIKATSADGSIAYSNVVTLSPYALRFTPYTLYPNPVINSKLNVKLENVVAGKYNIGIYNALGQKVHEQVINHNGGSTSHALSINKLATGFYNVTITSTDSKQQVYQSGIEVQ